ncbi:PAS domain S-box protein [Pontibacter ummariensis]|uniref:PAS domain S-box protein n=1 Tax=Pontibacter ummariensis TaxID=1610492 RepID=UPI0011863D95|nr:PAS domain S-box protein [Pontibacter ummariensis]
MSDKIKTAHRLEPGETVEKPVQSVLAIFNKAQGRVREMLMKGLPLQEVLDELIRVIQETHPDMRGSVLALNAAQGTLHPVSGPSLSQEYSALINGAFIGPESGSCGTAAFTKSRVLVADISQDPLWAQFRKALDYGLKACWSHPIFSAEGEVLGTFAMYYTSLRTPTTAEVELLELAAGLAGTAIEWKQVLNERTLLEGDLRKANEELLELNADLDKRVKERTAELVYQSQVRQTVTDNATAALFMKDEFGCCTYMNPAAQAMTGYTLEEVVGQPLHNIIHYRHPDGSAFDLGDCVLEKALLQNMKVRGHEDVFIRKDGSFFPVSCAASPIQENGKLIGTVVEVRDVSQERRAQQEVMESSERFRLLLEAMPQFAWTAKPNGQLDFISTRWIAYIGGDEDEGLGESWVRSLHPKDTEHALQAWAKALNTGSDYEAEFRVRRYDGTYRWFLARALPLTSKDGEVKKWFGTTTDIHEQRLAIQKLAEAQEQLKRTNNELNQKNRELTQTNADLDNFVYTASHDLRAPIINLEALLQVLEEDLTRDTVVEVSGLLGMMKGSVSRFKKTIEDLTDISKTKKSQAETKENIILSELMEEIRESVQELVNISGVTITGGFSEVPHFLFPRKNLRSLVYNLVSNGVKYRSAARPSVVKVSTARIGGMVRLRVQDNGLGVAVENKEHLFGMFKRFHDHVEGSGVGLYIVKRIVENANGYIEVDSKLGSGTTFDVYLPI